MSEEPRAAASNELLEHFQHTGTAGPGVDLLERETTEVEPEQEGSHAAIRDSGSEINSKESIHGAE